MFSLPRIRFARKLTLNANGIPPDRPKSCANHALVLYFRAVDPRAAREFFASYAGRVRIRKGIIRMNLVESVVNEHLKSQPAKLSAGDRVRVHLRIVEGDRERIQVFQGVVMRQRGGGIKENFTVRRIGAHGVGVERTFFVHSPRLEKVEIVSHAHVRRAQLYYLRGRTGKAARLREKRVDTRAAAAAPAATEPEAAAE